MKKDFTFKYGSSSVALKIEESQIIDTLVGKDVEAIKDLKGSLFQSLDSPIDSKALKEVAKKGDKIALVISDMTRFWMRQDKVVPLLISYLVDNVGVAYDDIKIIVATGTHVGAPVEDLKTLVTEDIYDKVEVINHDCRAEDLVYLGTTSYKTEVRINKVAAEADLVICLGAATYHVMAGFGGGRKSILPGISSLETIKHNHAYSLEPVEFKTNHKIGNGVLKGNPLNEDMLEAAAMMKNLFMISLVTDSDFNLTGIFSGHYYTSWLRACEEVQRIYDVQIDKKADVVITSCGGFPKDESLYQGTKAVDNAISALKDGGTLILLLEGRNGGGSPDYFDWIKPLVNGTFEKELRENFTVGGYIFFLNCEQAAKYNIMMYSSIDKDIVKPMGIKAYDDLDKLMSDADLEGKSIYVIPNGSTVLAKMKEE